MLVWGWTAEQVVQDIITSHITCISNIAFDVHCFGVHTRVLKDFSQHCWGSLLTMLRYHVLEI